MFKGAYSIGAGEGPDDVTGADLNHDGYGDIIVANYGPVPYSSRGTVSVILAAGDGGFMPAINYANIESPSRVVLTSLKNDGVLDLIVPSGDEDSIYILAGESDAGFVVGLPRGCNHPDDVVPGDFDDDGSVDLAIAERTGVEVWINDDGGHHFSVLPRVGDPQDYIQTLAAGDFNGDNELDVVTGNVQANSVSVFLGVGDGTFLSPVDYSVGDSPPAVLVGDWNGDSVLDLAVANQLDGTVSILLGRGDGTFDPQVSYPAGYKPVSLAAADFDGDGKLDLAVVDKASNIVYILRGHGDGTFAAPYGYLVGSVPKAVYAADFNGDGRADLAVANSGEATVSVLLSTGCTP